jgi:hypothetical protein
MSTIEKLFLVQVIIQKFEIRVQYYLIQIKINSLLAYSQEQKSGI